MKRMAGILFCLVLAAVVLTGCNNAPAPSGTGGEASSGQQEAPQVSVKVQSIVFEDPHRQPEYVFADESGEAYDMGDDPSAWFCNAEYVRTVMGDGQELTENTDGTLTLPEGGYLLIEFEMEGELYTASVGVGTVFVLKETQEGREVILDENWYQGRV